MPVNTTEKLSALRSFMQKEQVNVVIIPSDDAHSSEYVASCDERRQWISGFTGSAGTAVVTLNEALMWTDGRYFNQAGLELDSNWKLMKQGLPHVPTVTEFVTKKLEKNARVGIDATLISATEAKKLRDGLEKHNSILVELSKNPIDVIWGNERPARPHEHVFPLDIKYTGKSTSDKLKRLREQLVKREAKMMVISMLDEVAWLFNLRGSDIAYNPVFFAYATVTADSVTLFINSAQVSKDVKDHLGDHVVIKPYDSFFDELRKVGKTFTERESVLLGRHASLAIASAFGKDIVNITRSPVADSKSLKNEVEIEGFRQCHIRDGAALAKYFAWLEEELALEHPVDETQGSDRLEAYRKEAELFQGLSFPTISSAGPNGAIIHYHADPKNSRAITKNEIYLCDSGAQFLDGTTDTTRTWHFGAPTDEEKRAFTRVLQGHIALAQMIFPEKTSGLQLDAFARRPLWEEGLDYRHGTGHGVGHFLNVHEGPQGIGLHAAYHESHLRQGMVLSNEPGYYKDGGFGIRIENIVIVRPAQTPNNFGDRKYFGFETITMSPIHRKLIDANLLTPKERQWLNTYHEDVFSKVSPLLQEDKRALDWLERECQKLEVDGDN